MTRDNGIGRRDFMRVAGAAATGATLIGHSRSQAASAGAAFRELQRIPLTVENPSALAVGSSGGMYVAGENAVVALDSQGKETARLSAKGRPGCLAVSSDGKLLLGMRSHVDVLDGTGTVVASWKDLGERAWLTSIAADDENVYVADAGNRVVLRFGHDGNVRGRIGERDKERGVPGLVVPSPYFDVAIDPQGALWVVNPGKHGLENYRPNGELVSSWYRSGMEAEAFCGCCNPIHIAFRSDNTLVTAEKGLSRVKVYAPDTTLLGVVAAEAAPPIGENKALFCNVEPPIMDLAVDQQDRILVLNKPEKAILVYEMKREG
jgi:DNA-binding beta-propeller fold protein YncE